MGNLRGDDAAGQVEQKRLGIPRQVPAAVQQWVNPPIALQRSID